MDVDVDMEKKEKEEEEVIENPQTDHRNIHLERQSIGKVQKTDELYRPPVAVAVSPAGGQP